MGLLETESWTADALTLIDSSTKLLPEIPAYMFIRHSHRNTPADFYKIRDEPLTEIGKSAAYEFGSRLNPLRHYHLLHSPILRCKTTAQQILLGLESQHIKASFDGVFPILLNVAGIHREQLTLQIRDKKNYVPNWIGGFYNPVVLEPALHYSQRAATHFLPLHRCAQPNDCFIFVGHDDMTMVLRNGWLGIPPDDKWMDFLGGFLMQIESQHFRAFHRGVQSHIPFPYWWNRL